MKKQNKDTELKTLKDFERYHNESESVHDNECCIYNDKGPDATTFGRDLRKEARKWLPKSKPTEKEYYQQGFNDGIKWFIEHFFNLEEVKKDDKFK